MKLSTYDIRLLTCAGVLISCNTIFSQNPPAASSATSAPTAPAVVVTDPAKLYKSLEDALKAKFDNATKRGDLPDILLLLSIIVDDAKLKGEKAPDYNLCDLGTICKDNKGIKRIDMPQLSGKPVTGSPADKLPKDKNGEVDVKEQFAQYLINDKKYALKEETILVKDLKPTQNELVGSKVAGISFALEDPASDAAKDITNSYLFISRDNYILDGHHRWAAVLGDAVRKGKLAETKIKVKRIDAPMDDLVKIAYDWAGKYGLPVKSGDTSKGTPTTTSTAATKST